MKKREKGTVNEMNHRKDKTVKSHRATFAMPFSKKPAKLATTRIDGKASRQRTAGCIRRAAAGLYRHETERSEAIILHRGRLGSDAGSRAPISSVGISRTGGGAMQTGHRRKFSPAVEPPMVAMSYGIYAGPVERSPYMAAESRQFRFPNRGARSRKFSGSIF